MTIAKSAKLILLAMTYLAGGLVLLEFKGGSGGERFSSGHEDVECATCHTLVADLSGKYVGDFITNQDCMKCHQSLVDPNSAIPLSFHRNNNRNCLDCHSFHNSRYLLAKQKAFEFNYENQSVRMLCASCHGPGTDIQSISAGHIAAADVYHSDSKLLTGLSPSESCLLCHSSGSNLMNNKSLSQIEIPRFSRHATHPLGIRIPLGKGNGRNGIRRELDPRIRLIGDRIECQSCHSLTRQDSNLPAGFSSEKELCSGCHEHYKR